MCVSGVYAIVNLENGKHYIGQSARVAFRCQQHEYYLRMGKHSNPALQASWNTHDAVAFAFVHIETVDKQQLDDRETYWLAQCKERGLNLYNYGVTAYPRRGTKLTEEHKRKLSIAHTGKKLSDAHRQTLSDVRKGRVMSAEWCAKISAAHVARGTKPPGNPGGYKLSPETRARMSAARTGYKVTDACRANSSIARKKWWAERKCV